MIEQGRKDGAVLVCPGHGAELPFSKAESIMDSARKDAVRLTGIALFDRERSRYLAEYGVVLLEEASRMFSIIAARLLKVSYYLELLEEQEKANTILGTIDMDVIDETVAEFQAYVDELKGAPGAPLIAKAVQFSRKVNRIFEPEKIAHLFDPRFLRRMKTLLSDFVNVVYGIRYEDQERLFDLQEAIAETIESIAQSPHEKDTIF